jgi:CheY-like chemotaxis protein
VFRAAPARFDAVITDAIMPEMPGTELLAQIRQLRPEIPALLVSGYGGPDLQSQAAAAGVPILGKPLHASELAAALATALTGRREHAAQTLAAE